jgi:hypothetical protein
VLRAHEAIDAHIPGRRHITLAVRGGGDQRSATVPEFGGSVRVEQLGQIALLVARLVQRGRVLPVAGSRVGVLVNGKASAG